MEEDHATQVDGGLFTAFRMQTARKIAMFLRPGVRRIKSRRDIKACFIS